jgi:hypothetical protein
VASSCCSFSKGFVFIDAFLTLNLEVLFACAECAVLNGKSPHITAKLLLDCLIYEWYFLIPVRAWEQGG